MPMISTALIFERSNRAPAMGNQAPNRQHDYGADGRRDEARALIGSVPAQHSPEIRGQERTHDPENGRQDKSARFVLAGHDEFRNHACDKADNDDPKDTHGILLLPSPPLRPVNLPPRSFAAKVFASYNVRTAKANGPKSKGESCRRNSEVAISRRSVVAATGKGVSAKQDSSPAKHVSAKQDGGQGLRPDVEVRIDQICVTANSVTANYEYRSHKRSHNSGCA